MARAMGFHDATNRCQTSDRPFLAVYKDPRSWRLPKPLAAPAVATPHHLFRISAVHAESTGFDSILLSGGTANTLSGDLCDLVD